MLVAGSFGPWVRSGDRLRTSYELFQVADRLGFLGGGFLRWLPRAWVCLPLLAALAFAAEAAGRRRLSLVLIAVAASAGVVVSTAVVSSPLPAEWGCVAGIVGSVVGLCSVVAAVAIPRLTSPRLPTSPSRTCQGVTPS